MYFEKRIITIKKALSYVIQTSICLSQVVHKNRRNRKKSS
jgi:hypothetical protein